MAAPFMLLHGGGHGILTVARGTVPLAVFGPANYGYRLGLLGAPDDAVTWGLIVAALAIGGGIWVAQRIFAPKMDEPFVTSNRGQTGESESRAQSRAEERRRDQITPTHEQRRPFCRIPIESQINLPEPVANFNNMAGPTSIRCRPRVARPDQREGRECTGKSSSHALSVVQGVPP